MPLKTLKVSEPLALTVTDPAPSFSNVVVNPPVHPEVVEAGTVTVVVPDCNRIT